jgi:hypothetical protein
MADDAASVTLASQHDDEQPYFLIDSGEMGEEQPVGAPAEIADDPTVELGVAQVDAPEAEAEAAIGLDSELADESADAVAVDADADAELPEDLQAVSDLLDRPTAEIMAISDEDGAAIAAADEDTAEETPAAAEASDAAADSLDDIAPGTVADSGAAAASGDEPAAAAELSAAAAEVAVPEGVRTKVSWWPFIGYMVVWLGAAAYAVWQLQMLPTGQAAYESDFYSQTMLGGLVLLGMGPVLLLVVWLASWIGHHGAKIGSMFISALIKGATATLFGAVVWMGALMLIDYLRLGRPF